jgi:hypothetical protein
MKILPAELRQKLLQNTQVKDAGAAPSLRVVATQSTTNTLLSELMHKDIPADFGDVAIRQLSGETSPSLAYACCIDEGIAEIYERRFPAYMENPWSYVWSLGAASEVAIEFNGVWELDTSKQWYFLRTELTPYIFFVSEGTLYLQKWNDEDTRIPLAEGVSQISACRAWQSTDEPLLDQGLIIGYLKDGEVYYRALCLQESGELVWETERQITELGSENDTLNVFRTNDFRVGFICENAGGFSYVLSSRNYAGQSVRPESIYGQVVENCYVKVTPIQYLTAYGDGAGFALSSIPQPDCYIGSCKEYPVFEIVSTERTSDTEYVITCSHEMQERLPLTNFISIVPDILIGSAPVAASVVIDENILRITADKPVSFRQRVQINLQSYSSLRFRSSGTSWLLVPVFTAVFPPEPVYADDSTVTAAPLVETFINKRVYYSDYDYEEQSSISISYSCTLAATQVGPVPI